MIWFEWDPAKERSNQRKHGISFAIAQHVFGDLHAFSEQDRIEGGERRWQTLGLVGGVLLLLVVHTVQNDGADEIIRLISSRRRDRQERQRYENDPHRNES